MALRELFATFGIEVDDKKLVSAGATLDHVAEKLESFGKLLGGAFLGAKVGEFINSQIEFGSELNDTSLKLGVTTDELQRFRLAAGLAGVDAAAAGDSLKYLNKALGGVSSGDKAATAAFKSIGVSVKDAEGNVRSATDLIPDIADGFKKLGTQGERTELAMKLFGRSGTALIPILQEGGEAARQALAEYDELGGGMSSTQVEAADAAGDAIDKLKFTFRGFGHDLSESILPVVEKVATAFTKFSARMRLATNNGQLMKKALALGVVPAAYGAFKGLRKVSDAVGPLGKAFKGLYGSIGNVKALGQVETWKELGGVFKTLASNLKFPALILLALVLEDIYTWLTGGKSLIGEFLTEFLGAEEANALATQLRDTFTDVGATLKSLLPDGIAFAKDFLGAVSAILPSVATGIKVAFEGMSAFLNLGIGGIKALKAAMSGDFGEAGKLIDKYGDKAFAAFDAPAAKPPTEEAFVGPVIPRSPTSFQRGGPGGVAPTMTNQTTVTVNLPPGMTNPQAIGQAVGRAVQSAGATNRAALAAVGS